MYMYVHVYRASRTQTHLHVLNGHAIPSKYTTKVKVTCWHVSKGHSILQCTCTSAYTCIVYNLGVGDGTEPLLFEFLSGLLVVSQVQLGSH